jgi:chromosome transmission fidelity protein 1
MIAWAQDDAAGAGAGAGRGYSTSKGSEYYENLCMRAVNQSIGRSIRHKDDYSMICLLDGRYAQSRIKSKLPGWIGDRVTDTNSWGQVVAATAEFFRAKKAALAGSG